METLISRIIKMYEHQNIYWCLAKEIHMFWVVELRKIWINCAFKVMNYQEILSENYFIYQSFVFPPNITSFIFINKKCAFSKASKQYLLIMSFSLKMIFYSMFSNQFVKIASKDHIGKVKLRLQTTKTHWKIVRTSIL